MSKRAILRSWALCLLLLPILVLAPRSASAQEITLVVAGDMEWSRIVKAPAAFMYVPETEAEMAVRGVPETLRWEPTPYLNLPENRAQIEERFTQELEPARAHHKIAIQYGLEFDDPVEENRYPFVQTREIFQAADIAFANLEMPLSTRARHTGAFRGDPGFADALRWAGFDVVSTANNHAFDAEEVGLLDTIEELKRAGVGSIGSGYDLEDARRPVILERDGIRVAFLGYARAINVAGSSGFAQPSRSGVMPLDPLLIREDIRRVRDQVDYVILSFHWAVENSKETHPEARSFAHEMIDAGADIILGHHPHVPRGVEAYNGKVIFYSLGNYTFGHNHNYWGDGYLGSLTLGPEGVSEVRIHPLAGTGNEMAQPFLLEGRRARTVLDEVQMLSGDLDTELTIDGDVGIIRP